MIDRISSASNLAQERRRYGLLFLVLAVTFGAVQTYACRYELDPDSMDYLDISREVAAGHWAAAVNGYWGTLQSVLLAPLFLLHPSPKWELPLAHIQIFFILIAAFFAFRSFLNQCLDDLKSAPLNVHDRPLGEYGLCLIGYTLFLWSSLVLVPVKAIGPDLLVTAFIYLAGWGLLRLQRNAPLSRFVSFGAILGVGYWTKAIMFPIGLVFLAVAMVRVMNWKRSLVSVLAFFITAAPLLAALSFPRGRFTFGDSGKLNYSSLVSPGGRVINWQGLPAGTGIPKHPTRRIAGDPPIYEFAGPIAGTYPPSYDPSYWNEGRKATFSLRSQLRVISEYLPRVVEVFFVAQSAITAGFLVFLLWNPGSFANLARHWELLAVSFAIVGLYTLVNFETRFIGAFAVFFWFSAFLAMRIPSDRQSQGIAKCGIIALAIATLLSVASDTGKKIAKGCPESAMKQVEIAQELNLPAGTPVAVIGAGNFAYWAHFSQARIVAEIMAGDDVAFWGLPDSKREERLALLRAAGARWVIAEPPSVLIAGLSKDWQQIGTTGYFRRYLV